jgi:transcription antitermination factor NusG
MKIQAEPKNNNKKWYAIYTKPRAEKKVAKQLEDAGYIVYLPLKTELRQWKDRLKKVDIPLFNSYVFVKINAKEYLSILQQINGIVRFVTIGGEKIEVREEEIETIKQLLSYRKEGIETSSEEFFKNEKVEIKFGALKGLRGELVELRGKHKISIRIESLRTNILVEIEKKFVEKIKL